MPFPLHTRIRKKVRKMPLLFETRDSRDMKRSLRGLFRFVLPLVAAAALGLVGCRGGEGAGSSLSDGVLVTPNESSSANSQHSHDQWSGDHIFVYSRVSRAN